MTLEELARLGQTMRKAQDNYFNQGRTPKALAMAKDAERKFDEAARDVLNPKPPGLFDKQPYPVRVVGVSATSKPPDGGDAA